jgi:peptidoglycan/LPS O-acetylase OafA/YrhL
VVGEISSPVISAHLDVIRSLAALAVLYTHTRVLFIASVDMAEDSIGVLDRALYIASSYGHTAVMVFFVLSGLLVSSSIRGAILRGRWSWFAYFVNRWSRLSVVLIPALLLTLFWDSLPGWIGLLAIDTNQDTAAAIISRQTLESHTSLKILASNALYLQTIWVPPLGSNTALWSLANEFWYYLIFPCFALAVAARSGASLAARVAYLVLGACLLLFVGPEIAAYMSLWLFGALVGVIPRLSMFKVLWILRAYLVATSSLLLLLLVAIGVGRMQSSLGNDIILGVVIAIWLFGVLHADASAEHHAYRRLARFFAGFSYSLYATHLPFLIFMRECFTAKSAWQPTAAGWLSALGVALLAMIVAYLFSLVTESRTDIVRRSLMGLRR